MGEIDEKTLSDSQDLTPYALIKTHAETVDSATPYASLDWMPEKTFMPIPPFQSHCFPRAHSSVL